MDALTTRTRAPSGTAAGSAVMAAKATVAASALPPRSATGALRLFVAAAQSATVTCVAGRGTAALAKDKAQQPPVTHPSHAAAAVRRQGGRKSAEAGTEAASRELSSGANSAVATPVVSERAREVSSAIAEARLAALCVVKSDDGAAAAATATAVVSAAATADATAVSASRSGESTFVCIVDTLKRLDVPFTHLHHKPTRTSAEVRL